MADPLIVPCAPMFGSRQSDTFALPTDIQRRSPLTSDLGHFTAIAAAARNARGSGGPPGLPGQEAMATSASDLRPKH